MSIVLSIPLKRKGVRTMTIVERISVDLKDAMRARDEGRTGALRLIRAELLKAEKEKNQVVDDQRAMAILQTMIKQRHDSIEQFERAGRVDLADKERAEAVVIEAYLPEPLDSEEILALIDIVLKENEPADARAMGKIMGQVVGKLKATGRPYDAKFANERVRARLGMAG